MVWGVQTQAHQPEQRRDEALGLPKRQVEEQAQGQRREDRQVRVTLLPARAAGRRRSPPEGRFGEPDGDVASGAQPALVRGPVPDAIPLFLLGVHSAGFRRRHGCVPSTAWNAELAILGIHAPKPCCACSASYRCAGPGSPCPPHSAQFSRLSAAVAAATPAIASRSIAGGGIVSVSHVAVSSVSSTGRPSSSATTTSAVRMSVCQPAHLASVAFGSSCWPCGRSPSSSSRLGHPPASSTIIAASASAVAAGRRWWRRR